MRTLNKSSSMPSFPQRLPEATLTGKPRRNRLQQLQNEVNKSRIAIQNMSHTRAIEGGLHNQVKQLQKELHSCIISLNNESEKGKALAQLVGLLKGQMSAAQAVQKTSQEFVACGIEKKIKKVEYDIKQILHKYNEQIAKINLLKEQANAARDERVVYSNLFNKIEKEIKHYEEHYKQTLIKNEIFLDKKRARSVKHTPGLSNVSDQSQEFLQKCQKIQFKERNSNAGSSKRDLKSKEQLKGLKYTDRMTNQIDTFLITNPRETNKTLMQSFHVEEPVVLSQTQKTNSRGLERQIRKKEAAIESAIVQAQCRSQEEVLRLYSTIDVQNDELIDKISTLNQHIGYMEDQIDRIIKQKRSSQVYQNRQLSQILNMTKKCRTNKVSNAESTVAASSIQHYTKQICELLGVDSENFNDDVLKEVDMKIQDLGCNVVTGNGRIGTKMTSGDELSDKGVCDLLQKIDKFGQSEKIFDRNMLRAEYHKEVNKVRKRGKKSN